MTDIVERLRGGVFYLAEPVYGNVDKEAVDRLMVEAADEIERLREALDIAHKMRPLPEYRDDPRLQEVIEEQRAEIERLRGAYEQERKDCINLTEKVIPNLRDEIERLRGLLREYSDVVRLVREGKPVPLAYLEDRIREALGDD